MFINASKVKLDVEYIFDIIIYDALSGDENIAQGELTLQVKFRIFDPCTVRQMFFK